MPDYPDAMPRYYSSSSLATRYGLSLQQATRYIDRFGADRQSLDRLLSSAFRTSEHRAHDTERSIEDVTYG